MTTLTGTLLDSGGTPITGTLWLTLSQAATAPGPVMVSPLSPAVFALTAGQISGPGAGPYTVYGNDVLTPAVTFYKLVAFDADGRQALRLNVLVTGSTQDLGALVVAPTQSWVVGTSSPVTLGGDVVGSSSANTVVKIRGKSVSAPPWTPGDVLTVQADQSIAPETPVTGGGGVTDGDKGDVIVSGAGTAWALDVSGVIAGAYGGPANSCGVVVDAKGRITSISAPDISVNIATGTHGTLQVARGGTAATTAADARTNLGAAATSHTHAQADVTNLTSDLAAKKTDSMSTNKLLGRGTAGAGVIEEITLGTNLTLSGTTLNAASGSSTSAPSGTIAMWGAAAAPTGWLLCTGTAVSRATYSTLFAVIGTTFGIGDGTNTFNLPDLQQRFPLGKGSTGTGSTLGGTGGAIDHVHTVDPPNSTTGTPSATTVKGGTGGSTATSTHTHDIDIAAFNSGPNNPPYLVLHFIIKT